MLHKIHRLVGIRDHQLDKRRELIAQRGREFQTKIGDVYVWFRLLNRQESMAAYGRERGIGIVQTQYHPFDDTQVF